MKMVLCSYIILAIGLSGCTMISPNEGGKGQSRYDTKMKVFIDGEFVGESDVADRYDRKKLAIDVVPGSHVVVVEGYAKRDGKWEKRTKEKGYFINHRLEKEVDIGTGKTRIINFVATDTSKLIKIKL